MFCTIIKNKIIIFSIVILGAFGYAQPPKIDGKTWEKVEKLSDEFNGKK